MAMEAPSSEDPLIGVTVAGRYRVGSRIARGGMGYIYDAVQIGLGRDVALKVMHSESDKDAAEDFAKRMLNEAAAAAKLSHPNTIVIHDYGHLDDGRCFIAMERLRGRTLGELIAAEGPLDAQAAVHIALQITGSLAEAHAAGMIHRDLKPGNIMLTLRGADEHFVKVLDFGLVKKDPKDTQVDESGALVGTPRYMAPEQVVTEPVSEATDVYSLGATLYHVLSGRPPFDSDSRFALMAAHVTTQPRSMAEVSEEVDLDVPPTLEAVVMRCLQKDPADRFRSMTELAEALLDAIGEDATATMRASLPPSHSTLRRIRAAGGSTETDMMALPVPTEEPKSRTGMFVIGVLTVAAIVTGLLFVSLEGTPTPEPTPEPTPVAAEEPVEEPEPPEVVATEPTVATEPPVAPAETHEVTVTATPATATLHRGEDDLGDSPLTVEVPDGERWTLEVRAAGYRTRTITLSGAQREVHVRLLRRPRSSAGSRESSTEESTGRPHRSDNRNPWADDRPD